MLLLHPINLLAFASFDENIEDTNSVKATIIPDDNKEVVPLYENPSESSEVISNLENKDEVIIKEGLDDFSLVQYTVKETGKTLEGFVKNNNLLLIENNFDTPEEITNQLKEENVNGIESEVQATENVATESASQVENPSDQSEDQTPSENKSDVEEIEEHLDENKEKVAETGEQIQKLNAIYSIESNTTTQQQIAFLGIALKDPTRVYSSQSINSNTLKTYDQGSILKYKSLNSNWYEATVYINGKAVTGFIYKNDVENITNSPTSLKGVGLKSPTKVYEKASTSSKVLKSYTQGSILKYKTFTSNWYEASVYINGKAVTGFIYKNDVENITNSPTSLKGVGLKSPTKVYEKASTSSKVLKSYTQGSILKYKTFTSNWYEATVYINGKEVTGFIYKNDVENITNSPTSLKGVGLKSPTKVYEKASTSSKVLKSYTQGSILKYKTFTSNWYEATVYINGKEVTGFIYKNDVETANTSKSYRGFALQDTTHVYSIASDQSKTLKSYKKGQVLKYKSFVSNWYEATIYIDGKSITGYILKSDVITIDSNNQVNLKTMGLKHPTNVYGSASTDATVIKTYPEGSILNVRTYSQEWFEATVYVDGKPRTGYFLAKDVEIINPKQKTLTGYAAEISTNVYTRASKNSNVIKSYYYGSKLKFKTFSSQWYEATVYVNGLAKTGYIHKDNVVFNNVIKRTYYDITLNEALQIQMKASPLTDQNYAYVSAQYIKDNMVTASSLKVRKGPGTNYGEIGSLTKGTKVTIINEYNGWYQIKYPNNSWVIASEEDTLYYLNPENFLNDEKQIFQFLDLTKPSGASAAVLNKFLKGKGVLEGKGQAFIDAAKKHGINDVYLISHALLETGNGTSSLAKGIEYNGVTVYNFFGIGAYDNCPEECGAKFAYEQGWTKPEKAIIGGAAFIGNEYIKAGQNTLYKMRWNPEYMAKNRRAGHQYASDIGWAVKQTTTFYNIYQQLDSYLLYLEITTYKK